MLELKAGGVLPLGSVLDSELILTAQGKPVAKGELVIVGNQFGMRITDLLIATKKSGKGSGSVEIEDLLSEPEKSKGEKAFCAGASFDELISINDLETGTKFFSGFAHVINAARKCPKLIIGRIQGKAVGGGVGMASAVDFCYATKNADIKLSELAVGIGPFVVGPAVERKIGTSAMSMLAINATEWYSADWAKEKSLYAETFETIAEMDKAIAILADKLASSNPDAMSMLKKVFWEGTDHWDTLLIERAGMSGKLVLSDFTRNAINAFKSK